MKKGWLPILFLLLACQFLSIPKDDSPPPPPTEPGTPFPLTVIVELPPITFTATLEPHPRPILAEDMADAETFFLILKTSMLAGDDVGVAERVKYPLPMTLGTEELIFQNKDDLLARYTEIFDQAFMDRLLEYEDTDLTLQPDGVRLGQGELWFNSFCSDLSCSDSQFLITQVNK